MDCQTIRRTKSIPSHLERIMSIGEDINDLIVTYSGKQAALEAEFEVMATALAWGIVGAVFKGDPTQLPAATIPTSRGNKMSIEEDDDAEDEFSQDTLTLTKRPSKRVRYVGLLEAKSGKWARRDSDNVYACIGPADEADHFRMQLDGAAWGSKVIKVSLVSILSKWNHIP